VLFRSFHLEKAVQFVSRAEAEDTLEQLLQRNDHLSFYYPGGVRDPKTVRMNTWNRTAKETDWFAPFSKLVHEVTDHALTSYAPGLINELAKRDAKSDPVILALNREKPVVMPAPVAFARRLFYTHDEIEYALPQSNIKPALHAVMKLLADEEFDTVVEVRFTPDSTRGMIGPGTAGRGAGGAAWIELATALGAYSDGRRAQVYAKFDEVLRAHGGRPHLGKKTAVDARGMEQLHGESWRLFQALRQEWDPTGKFLPRDNLFLRKVFTQGAG